MMIIISKLKLMYNFDIMLLWYVYVRLYILITVA